MYSPGHCAQLCTYNIIENESKDIIHIVTVDRRERQRSSVVMGKQAFIRTIDQLILEIQRKERTPESSVDEKTGGLIRATKEMDPETRSPKTTEVPAPTMAELMQAQVHRGEDMA
ncbi:hypothetical protein J4Q44_G00203080 [Coregonus suidteri]|uniref:Uncharacterized protein n=1 Tax=Coregonus suidteri TaxID=861788 RepID=A0AAN8LLT8_9TELE